MALPLSGRSRGGRAPIAVLLPGCLNRVWAAEKVRWLVQAAPAAASAWTFPSKLINLHHSLDLQDALQARRAPAGSSHSSAKRQDGRRGRHRPPGLQAGALLSVSLVAAPLGLQVTAARQPVPRPRSRSSCGSLMSPILAVRLATTGTEDPPTARTRLTMFHPSLGYCMTRHSAQSAPPRLI